LSRIWGGIHPYIDDIPGRIIGNTIGNESFEFGASYFSDNLSTTFTDNPRLKLKSNPINSNEQLEILNTLGIENFELFNLIGQRISILENYNPSSKSTTLSHEYLAPGIYLLNNKNYSWKIIVR